LFRLEHYYSCRAAQRRPYRRSRTERSIGKPAGLEVQQSRVGQGRPIPHRYRLQVGRQTKSSFEDKEAAEKAGKAIKKADPVVEVTV
jgi:hypothetical protein